MKNTILIVFLFVSSLGFSENPRDTIKTFDLTIYEISSGGLIYEESANFHFDEKGFNIIYGENIGIKRAILTKKDFYLFFDSLRLLKIQSIPEQSKSYNLKSRNVHGNIKIQINNKEYKNIIYWGIDDTTKLFLVEKWLYKRARETHEIKDIKLLVNTYFQVKSIRNEDFIFPNIEITKNNYTFFNINNIITVYDSTQDVTLKNIMISSMVYYKDKRIIDILGKKLLMESDSSLYWINILFSAFNVQDSSSSKIAYLKNCLASKSNNVKLHSAISLANYGFNDGENILLTEYVKSIDSKTMGGKRDILCALTQIASENSLKALINQC